MKEKSRLDTGSTLQIPNFTNFSRGSFISNTFLCEGVDAWLSGPLFVSHPIFQCTTVHCKPRCIQFLDPMDVRFGVHNYNLNWKMTTYSFT